MDCGSIRLCLCAQNSVQSYFEELLQRVPKLYGVLVTDRDGVALVRGTTTQHNSSSCGVNDGSNIRTRGAGSQRAAVTASMRAFCGTVSVRATR